MTEKELNSRVAEAIISGTPDYYLVGEGGVLIPAWHTERKVCRDR